MKKWLVLGILAIVLLFSTVLAACSPAPNITVNVPPAPAPAVAPPTATGILGNSVQEIIQIQMLKDVLGIGTDATGGFGHHGGHGGHHGGD